MKRKNGEKATVIERAPVRQREIKKEIEKEVKLEIMKILGHNRFVVLSSYLE